MQTSDELVKYEAETPDKDLGEKIKKKYGG
jgi:hypothetical protein